MWENRMLWQVLEGKKYFKKFVCGKCHVVLDSFFFVQTFMLFRTRWFIRESPFYVENVCFFSNRNWPRPWGDRKVIIVFFSFALSPPATSASFVSRHLSLGMGRCSLQKKKKDSIFATVVLNLCGLRPTLWPSLEHHTTRLLWPTRAFTRQASCDPLERHTTHFKYSFCPDSSGIACRPFFKDTRVGNPCSEASKDGFLPF